MRTVQRVLVLVAFVAAAGCTPVGASQNAIAVNDSDSPVVIRFEGWHNVLAQAHSRGFALSELVGTIHQSKVTVMDTNCHPWAEHNLGADFMLITITAYASVTFSTIRERDPIPGGSLEDQPTLSTTALCS